MHTPESMIFQPESVHDQPTRTLGHYLRRANQETRERLHAHGITELDSFVHIDHPYIPTLKLPDTRDTLSKKNLPASRTSDDLSAHMSKDSLTSSPEISPFSARSQEELYELVRTHFLSHAFSAACAVLQKKNNALSEAALQENARHIIDQLAQKSINRFIDAQFRILQAHRLSQSESNNYMSWRFLPQHEPVIFTLSHGPSGYTLSSDNFIHDTLITDFMTTESTPHHTITTPSPQKTRFHNSDSIDELWNDINV